MFLSDARGALTCYDKPLHVAARCRMARHTGQRMAQCWCRGGAGCQQQKRCTAAGGFRNRADRRILQAHSCDALCGVELGEEYDDSDEPALYIYYAQQGERIFDIAKRYHARAGIWLRPITSMPTAHRRRPPPRLPAC